MNFTPEMIEKLRGARHMVVLTGAGVSQESGIPTFRDALTGLWERFDAEALATPQAFAADRDLVWGWYEWRRGRVLNCRPNAAHQAIARMERCLPKFSLLTQNVDDLHERAGSNVLHLHGSLHHPRCEQCGQNFEFPPGLPSEPEGGRRLTPPRCASCGGWIRPGVVWFGEALAADTWRQATEATQQCDVMFSVGTSSIVYPAAALPFAAAKRGACVIQVNPHPTDLDAVADYTLCGKAGDFMPDLVAAAWPETRTGREA